MELSNEYSAMYSTPHSFHNTTMKENLSFSSSSSSFSSSTTSPLESVALENFYSSYNYSDDPFKGRWECLYAGVDCNTVAFDSRGAYLAIGTADGQVSIL